MCIRDSSYTSSTDQLHVVGTASVTGQVTAAALVTSGAANVGNGLTVSAGGCSIAGGLVIPNGGSNISGSVTITAGGLSVAGAVGGAGFTSLLSPYALLDVAKLLRIGDITPRSLPSRERNQVYASDWICYS